MGKVMMGKVTEMGPLRNALQLTAVILVLLMPFSEVSYDVSGSRLFFAGILPAITPICFILIMMDILMCSIWRGEVGPERALILTRTMRVHFALAVILLAAWFVSFADALF